MSPPERGRRGGGGRRGGTRMHATVVPGLAPLVSGWLDDHPGVRVTGSGHDGRADLVLLDVDLGPGRPVPGLRLVEDVFVEVGRAERGSGDTARSLAGRLWPSDGVERALSVWSSRVRPLSRAMTFRVVARVLQERSFLRTELRHQLVRTIGADRPRWRVADPAQIEVWASEYRPGQLVAGLRLSDPAMRQHGGRTVERRGALRPTVAAAMVALAGEAAGTLLDPCCGSGTVLREALAAGWSEVLGGDIDREAVEAARQNAPGALVRSWDVRRLDLPDASVAAVVSNLPYGRQFEVAEPMPVWLGAALGELARVTRSGGRVVLLAPSLPAGSLPADLVGSERHRLQLLGVPTTLRLLTRA